MNLNWMQNQSWYPDGLHCLGAYAAILTFKVLTFVPHRFLNPPLWLGFTIVVAAAAIKEFVIDALWEKSPPQNFGDNFRDFCGYFLGAIIGVLVVGS